MDLTLSSQILLNPTTSGNSTMHSPASTAMTTFQVSKRILRILNRKKKKSITNEQTKANKNNQTRILKEIINIGQGYPRDEAQEEEMTVCNILRRHSELCAIMLIINTNSEKTTISTSAQGSFECLFATECLIWQ